MQCRALRLRRVTATQRRPTRRPARARSTRKVRLARSERTNETRVPVAIAGQRGGTAAGGVERERRYPQRRDVRPDDVARARARRGGRAGAVVAPVEPPEDADAGGAPARAVTWSVCAVEPTPFALSVTVSVTV